jgi:hypothetical protein
MIIWFTLQKKKQTPSKLIDSTYSIQFVGDLTTWLSIAEPGKWASCAKVIKLFKMLYLPILCQQDDYHQFVGQ